MSFEQIFDESYERVLSARRDGNDFFEAFYQRFLNDDRRIAQRFAYTDMATQQSMLKKSFYSLFAFYASGQADDSIRRIAERHNRDHLDINPELYDRWLECLIRTVTQFDDEISEDVELAWRLVMAPGITYMKFKYDK
ncbi:globin [Zobellella maritima]|uniref:globin n=1 Tax=Zobellella maritima TaxID=2059725 RepID=UPI000E2FFAF0|nr:globin [Zobellella maritima]